VIAFLVICVIIGAGVHSISSMAMRELPGDKVAALMALVESEHHTYRDRNRAIWALGQLGDPRALSLLQKYYTGKDSDEKNELSQYELRKAIELSKGATNIGAGVWRHGSWGTI
jgi:HEAT repeat protein